PRDDGFKPRGIRLTCMAYGHLLCLRAPRTSAQWFKVATIHHRKRHRSGARPRNTALTREPLANAITVVPADRTTKRHAIRRRGRQRWRHTATEPQNDR